MIREITSIWLRAMRLYLVGVHAAACVTLHALMGAPVVTELSIEVPKDGRTYALLSVTTIRRIS